MAEYDEILLSLSSRMSLIEQLLKLLFRERAFKNKQSLADIMKFSEEIKVFFENQMKNPEAEALMIANVDRFFTNLASDVARDQESRKD